MTVVAAVAAAWAAALGTRPPSRLARNAGAVHEGPGGLARWRGPLAALVGLGTWAFLGGVPGLAAAGLTATVAYRVVARAESPEAVRRRRVREEETPVAVDLVAAVLAAGLPVEAALEVVASALPGPVADDLGGIRRRLALGADPVRVWRTLEEPWRPLGRALARAHETGAAVAPAVERAAVELADRARRRRTELARGVEVRAAAPLGLCFLPAFLLLGVVPLVAGLVRTMHPFG